MNPVSAQPVRVLAGRRILVTRPEAEAAALAVRLTALGAVPVSFPVLDIELNTGGDIGQRLAPVASADLVIFVSPSAARSYVALRRLAGAETAGAETAMPLRLIAVGEGTARALCASGAISPRVPDRFDSEGVAAMPELERPAGLRIAIVCGSGGRRWLGAELERRGASVTHVECYRRSTPQRDIEPLLHQWKQDGFDAALITSSEGARNLWSLLGESGQPLWQSTPTFVPHERIRSAIAALGVRQIVTTPPGDEAAVDALTVFFA